MKSILSKKLSVIIILSIFLLSLQLQASDSQVAVSILPQSYFVKSIAEDLVDVIVLVKPGQSPATYDVTPRQMAELSSASLMFTIGVPFEKGLMPRLKNSLPNLEIINTSQGIALRKMKGHSHDCSDDHHHHHEEGLDPHIWLSPKLVVTQLETITEALERKFPEHRQQFRANLKKIQRQMMDLDTVLTEKLQKIESRKFMVFHPSWGYFADAYNLEQIPVEVQGKSPTARQLKEIIQVAKDENIRVVFVQPQFSDQSARSIARSINGRVIAIDPLAENYIENLKQVADVFQRELQP